MAPSVGGTVRVCECVLVRVHDACVGTAAEMAEEQCGWRFTVDGMIHWPSAEYAADVAIAQRVVPLTMRQRSDYARWLAGGRTSGHVFTARARIGGELLRRGLYPPQEYFRAHAPHSFPVRRRNSSSHAETNCKPA